MFSYTLDFKEQADQLAAPEHELAFSCPVCAGDIIILSDQSRHQVMFVSHSVHHSSLYLDTGMRRTQS